MKNSGNMEALIKKKCKENGISPEILTPEEMEELKSEIEAEQNEMFVLDGVLFNPDLFTREFEYQQNKKK